MENRAHALFAGIFTLLLGVSAVLALWWFGGKSEDTRSYLVVATKNVTGLNAQAQVRYRGVRVGRVEQIDLDSSDIRSTLIRIRIRADIPVTEGTIAKLGFQGVTGIAHVQLEDAGTQPRALAGINGGLPRIPMRDSFVQELAETGAETLHNVRDIVVGINQLLSPDNRQSIARTLANVEAATAQTRAMSEQLRVLLSSENIRHLQATLQSAERAADQVGPLFTETRALVAGLREVSEKVDRLIGDPVAGASGALVPGVNELTGELTTTSRQLNRVLQVLEESPQSLLFGGRRLVPGPGETGFVAPAERKESQ
ncbi:MlaD family protein [uncultured Propionivibrio sp.]|uniref:MlaD family protein n=1 Tax=uncultured Propionivibrio sp. TaxID=426737 RepID=UPI0029C0F4BF|nr:MlaD family protein [uncultured Propionivibrio sp.]